MQNKLPVSKNQKYDIPEAMTDRNQIDEYYSNNIQKNLQNFAAAPKPRGALAKAV